MGSWTTGIHVRNVNLQGICITITKQKLLRKRFGKNSKVSSVAKQVMELIDDKLESEGLEYRVDEENASRVAEAMIAAMKRL